MRRLHLVVLPLSLLVGQWAPLHSQEKNQPAPNANTAITQIEGRNLEFWISQISSPDQSKSEHAIRTVCLFGPDRAYQAVPAILDRLKKHFSKKADLSVRVNGVIALGFILGGYKEADHKYVREAVTTLKRFLSDNQNIVRLRAVQALGRMGADAKEAIPEVCNVVKDPETFETRQAAAIALGQIALDKAGPSLTVLKTLYGALSGSEPIQVRLAAIQSLTALGGPLNSSLRLDWTRALDQVAYKDQEPVVKIWAHMAVMSVTRNVDKERVDAIAPMVKNSEMAVRIQAIQALGMIGKDAKQTIPMLATALHDSEPTVVVWSMWALGRMGPAAAGAIPTLEQVRSDMKRVEIVRKLAEEAIDLINGKKK